MNSEQLHEYQSRFFALCLTLSKAKNHDYAGAGGETPFANFQLCERLGLCDTATGILVRMADKLSRLRTLLTAEGQVKDESFTDTCRDMANYAAILAAWMEDQANPMLVVHRVGTNGPPVITNCVLGPIEPRVCHNCRFNTASGPTPCSACAAGEFWEAIP